MYWNESNDIAISNKTNLFYNSLFCTDKKKIKKIGKLILQKLNAKIL